MFLSGKKCPKDIFVRTPPTPATFSWRTFQFPFEYYYIEWIGTNELGWANVYALQRIGFHIEDSRLKGFHAFFVQVNVYNIVFMNSYPTDQYQSKCSRCVLWLFMFVFCVEYSGEFGHSSMCVWYALHLYTKWIIHGVLFINQIRFWYGQNQWYITPSELLPLNYIYEQFIHSMKMVCLFREISGALECISNLQREILR